MITNNTPKYIFENGVMKLNPAYKAEQNAQGHPPTVASPDKALAIVSSTQDIAEASQVIAKPLQLSTATVASMEIMQDPEFLDKFHTKKPLDGGQLLDGISNIFAKYEVPIGLVNKLLALTEYDEFSFTVDDSGSMSSQSDFTLKEACLQLKQKYDPQGKGANDHKKLTRWDEVEDRLHIMLDMLAFIPTNRIVIDFLNRNDKIILEHKNKTPEQFAEEAHKKITQAFKNGPSGGTPIYRTLSEAFNKPGKVMHHLFTDGEPSDKSVEEVCDLVLKRRHPELHPLTFISCTEDDRAAEWMKEIEEKAPFTAEVDDFINERKEVLKDQGPGLPYSKGFWLLCQLVAAINPYDLDKMDESIPFSKKTMDDLLGRKLTPEEYQHYFRNNPNINNHIENQWNLPTFNDLYAEFSREDILADQIIEKAKKGDYQRGYSDAPQSAMYQPAPSYAPPAYAPPTNSMANLNIAPPAYNPSYKP